MLALGRYIPPDSTPKSTAKTPQISPNAPGRQKHTRHDPFPLLRFAYSSILSISRQHRFGRCRVDIDEHHTETGRCIFDAIGRSADPTARGNGIRKVSRLSPKVNARIAYTLVPLRRGIDPACASPSQPLVHGRSPDPGAFLLWPITKRQPPVESLSLPPSSASVI